MFEILSDYLQKKCIFLYSAIDLEDCNIIKPYLLEKEGIREGTVMIFAVPYFTPACEAPQRNLSAYAVSRDYHLFFRDLFREWIPLLQKQFPTNRFVGFADHSPIAEVDAAVRAGLGVLGKNGLLITEQYSSYVFLGELITDAKFGKPAQVLRSCEDCGRCRSACPASNGAVCLSALTQKKGILTKEEQILIQCNGSVWGCDICQQSCPHTENAIRAGSIYTKIPFFLQDTVSQVTEEMLDAFTKEAFEQRAFAWRGRPTVERNIKLMRKEEPPC